MSFEVFATEEKMKARAAELRSQGATQIIEAFNGSMFTIKWR